MKLWHLDITHFPRLLYDKLELFFSSNKCNSNTVFISILEMFLRAALFWHLFFFPVQTNGKVGWYCRNTALLVNQGSFIKIMYWSSGTKCKIVFLEGKRITLSQDYFYFKRKIITIMDSESQMMWCWSLPFRGWPGNF